MALAKRMFDDQIPDGKDLVDLLSWNDLEGGETILGSVPDSRWRKQEWCVLICLKRVEILRVETRFF